MANSEHMKKNHHRGVTLQQMSDAGINPFAVQLLCESYSSHPDPEPITFSFRGVQISLSLLDAEDI